MAKAEEERNIKMEQKYSQLQGKESNSDLFSNQYLFQKGLLSLTIEKS